MQRLQKHRLHLQQVVMVLGVFLVVDCGVCEGPSAHRCYWDLQWGLTHQRHVAAGLACFEFWRQPAVIIIMLPIKP
jgi:hypothetical protein